MTASFVRVRGVSGGKEGEEVAVTETRQGNRWRGSCNGGDGEDVWCFEIVIALYELTLTFSTLGPNEISAFEVTPFEARLINKAAAEFITNSMQYQSPLFVC